MPVLLYLINSCTFYCAEAVSRERGKAGTDRPGSPANHGGPREGSIRRRLLGKTGSVISFEVQSFYPFLGLTWRK